MEHNSTHENLGRRMEIRVASDRTFGLVMAAASGLVGLWPLVHHKTVKGPALAICGAFLLAALLRPALLRPLNRLWTALAAALNRVTNPIVCALLFYLVITPLACLLRLRGKDPLRLRTDRDAASYWIDRTPGPEAESMRLQF